MIRKGLEALQSGFHNTGNVCTCHICTCEKLAVSSRESSGWLRTAMYSSFLVGTKRSLPLQFEVCKDRNTAHPHGLHPGGSAALVSVPSFSAPQLHFGFLNYSYLAHFSRIRKTSRDWRWASVKEHLSGLRSLTLARQTTQDTFWGSCLKDDTLKAEDTGTIWLWVGGSNLAEINSALYSCPQRGRDGVRRTQTSKARWTPLIVPISWWLTQEDHDKSKACLDYNLKQAWVTQTLSLNKQESHDSWV